MIDQAFMNAISRLSDAALKYGGVAIMNDVLLVNKTLNIVIQESQSNTIEKKEVNDNGNTDNDIG